MSQACEPGFCHSTPGVWVRGKFQTDSDIHNSKLSYLHFKITKAGEEFVNTEARWKWPIIPRLKSGINQVVKVSLSFWLYVPEVTMYLVCVLWKTSPVLIDTSLCMYKTWFLFYTKIELPCTLYIFPVQHWHFLGLLSNSSMLMQWLWPFWGSMGFCGESPDLGSYFLCRSAPYHRIGERIRYVEGAWETGTVGNLYSVLFVCWLYLASRLMTTSWSLSILW